MNSNQTYADAVNGSAGVAVKTLSVPPTATNIAAAEVTAEASARSDVVEKKFEFPKKFCRSGIIGKETSSSPTNIWNNNLYCALDDDDLNEYGNYSSKWNPSSEKRKHTSSVRARNVRARKKPAAAASKEVDQHHRHPTT